MNEIIATLIELHNELRPVLYYAASEHVEEGQYLLCRDPEFVVCHPEDLGELRQKVSWRRLVHLRDKPPELSEVPVMSKDPFGDEELKMWLWPTSWR